MNEINKILQSGISFFNEKKYLLAEINFNEYLKHKPKDSLSHYNLSKVLEAKKEYSKARKEIETAISLDPLIPDYYFHLGCIETDEGNYQKAFDLFEKASYLEPDFIDSMYNAGVIATVLGKPDIATNYFIKLIEIEPEFLFAHNYLANYYIEKSRWKDAKKELDTALSICPDDPIIHHTYAIYYLNLKEYEKALSQINLSIDYQNEFTSKHEFLKAQIYYYKHDFDKSIQTCNNIIKKDPSFPFSFDGLGNNYLEKNELNTALEWFEKSINGTYPIKNSFEKLKIIYKKLNRENDYVNITKKMESIFPSKCVNDE